jgi:hypothetical protein
MSHGIPQTALHCLTSCHTPPGGLYAVFMLSTLLALKMFVNLQAAAQPGRTETDITV